MTDPAPTPEALEPDVEALEPDAQALEPDAEAEARAAGILTANRFIVLGSSDADGPWTAPVQYRLRADGALTFESHASSRHGLAIAAGLAAGRATVAGAIFDSSVAPHDADGLQLVADADDGGPLGDEGKRLFVLRVRRLWVFDPDAWRTLGRDRRIELRPEVVLREVMQSEAARSETVQREAGGDA